MTVAFRDWPWPLQALIFVLLGVLIVVSFLYVPGSPMRGRRLDLDEAKERLQPLQTEVDTLRDYDRQRGQLRGEMEALQKQLMTLQAIVPEDKQVDQFIHLLQDAALSSNISIRRLTTKPVVAKEYHYEMPFEVEADGSYYSILEFFGKLGRLSRIINVGDLAFTGIGESGTKKAHLAANASVTGTFTVTTFFTKAAGQEPAGAASKHPGKR